MFLHLEIRCRKKSKQVRQQACKTQIPPYSLKQRHRPQFQMPMPCSDAQDPLEPFIPEVIPPSWLPVSKSSPKGEKTCPDSSRTCMQNFTPLSFSGTEKSVTIQKNKQKITDSKLSIPILLYGGIYTVSQKTSHLYNLLLFLHTQFDCDNFGTNVAKKAGNQNVPYFPTSPN